jgi:hypothetical protein
MGAEPHEADWDAPEWAEHLDLPESEVGGWAEHPGFPDADGNGADGAGWVASVVLGDAGPGSPLHGSISLPAAEGLDAAGALAVAQSADRVIAWATAVKARALARLEPALAAEPLARPGSQPVRFGGAEAHAMAVAEAATSAAVSEATAARLLHEAADLTATPELLHALQDGEISYQHAQAILDQARTLPAPHAAAFARKALARAVTGTGRRRTPAELRRTLRRLRESLHPETITARRAAAAAGAGVWLAPEPDGMCTLTARLPAEAAHAIHHGIDHDARTARTAGAPGTLDQLRADALAHRLLARPDGTPAFEARIALTIPLALALGADQPGPEGAQGPEGQAGPAELEGYGPIDPATARRLAALAPNWERIFADPATGAALGVGRTAYRPPKALRRYLAHRDGGCTFPGCTTPPPRCEPDHTTEWQHGGTTDPHNLALLCPKHHALKSLRAWTYHHNTTDGTLTWTSPLGHTHTTEPHTPEPHTPEPPEPPQPPQQDQPPPF